MREGHANALGGVWPGLFEGEEEVFSGNDEDAALLEAFVELAGGDRELREPDPEKEGPLAAMDGVREGVSEAFVDNLEGALRFF